MTPKNGRKKRDTPSVVLSTIGRIMRLLNQVVDDSKKNRSCWLGSIIGRLVCIESTSRRSKVHATEDGKNVINR